nr:RdRp [signal crayfish associated reo-like virus 1]
MAEFNQSKESTLDEWWFNGYAVCNDSRQMAFEQHVVSELEERLNLRITSVEQYKRTMAERKRVPREGDASTSVPRQDGTKSHSTTKPTTKPLDNEANSKTSSGNKESRRSYATRIFGDWKAYAETVLQKVFLFDSTAVRSPSKRFIPPAVQREICCALMQYTHSAGSSSDCTFCSQIDSRSTLHVDVRKVYKTTAFTPIAKYDSRTKRAMPGNRKSLSKESYRTLSAYADTASSKDDASEAKAWLSLFLSTGVQDRGLALHDYILSYLTLATHQQGHIDSPFLGAVCDIIRPLLSNHSEFPWRGVLSKGRYTTRLTDSAKEVPLMLSQLIVLLMTQEIVLHSGMYHSREIAVQCAKLHLDVYCRDDSVGYYDNILILKDIPDIIPIVLGSKAKVRGIKWSEAGLPIGQSESFNIKDVTGLSTKMWIEAVTNYPRLNTIISLFKIYDRSSMLIAINSISAMVTTGIYIQQLDVVSSVKSQFSRHKRLVESAHVTASVYDTPLDFEPPESWRYQGAIIQRMASEATDTMTSFNIQRALIDSLAAKSAGALPQEVLDRVAQEPSPLIRKMATTKIGAVGLVTEIITNKDTWLNALLSVVTMSDRKQVLRRSRLIVAVLIALQITYISVAVCFKVIAKKYKVFSSGKQTGRIHDALTLLRSSGDPASICCFADVSGFDTSTSQMLVQYIRAICTNATRYNRMPLGWATPMVYPVTRNGITVGEVLSAPQVLRILASSRPVYTTHTDKHMNVPIDTSGATLASGALDTSAIGSLVTGSAVQAIVEKYPQDNITGSVSGDDISLTWKSSDNDKNILDDSVSNFNQYGYELDNLAHVGSVTYLQQRAAAGCLQSSIHRLTPITSERPEKLEGYEGITKLIGVMQEWMGRCRRPIAVVEMMTNLWWLTRGIQVNSSIQTTDPQAVRDPISGRSIIPLPMSMVFMSKLGSWQMPTMRKANGEVVLRGNALSLGGNACLYRMNRRIMDRPTGVEIREFIDAKKASVDKVKHLLSPYSSDFYWSRINDIDAEEFDLRRLCIYDQLIGNKIIMESRFENKEVGDAINKMVRNYHALEDQQSLTASRISDVLLQRDNITLPRAVVLHAKAETKIKGSFEGINASDREWIARDDVIASAYSKMCKAKWSNLVDKDAQWFDIWDIPTNDDVFVNVHTQLDGLLGVVPWATDVNEHLVEMMRIGTSSQEEYLGVHSVNQAFTGITGSEQGKALLEAARAVSWSSNTDAAVNLALTAMQLNSVERNAFLKAVNNGTILIIEALKINDPPKASLILASDPTMIVNRVINYAAHPNGQVNRALTALALCVERDEGFKHGSKKIELGMSPHVISLLEARKIR